MEKADWHIYVDEIPYSSNGPFWVSFESDPRLKKSRANIYGRCLPCIQNLYEQLKAGYSEIDIGTAYQCWKITAVLNGIEQCISLLSEFEILFSNRYVYGKFGSGRPGSTSRVVVFHTDEETERDRLKIDLEVCLNKLDIEPVVLISRACAALYENIFGDWKDWRPVMPIRFPENVSSQLEFVKNLLFRSTM